MPQRGVAPQRVGHLGKSVVYEMVRQTHDITVSKTKAPCSTLPAGHVPLMRTSCGLKRGMQYTACAAAPFSSWAPGLYRSVAYACRPAAS